MVKTGKHKKHTKETHQSSTLTEALEENPCMKNLCSIYKSPKEEGMYLYVDKQEGFERVPEALLKKFGEPELVMTIVLTADKKLAVADPVKVRAAIEDQGFYLQMPLRPEQYMQQLRERNTKL